MNYVIKKHLLEPQNIGEIKDADIIISHTNSVCGDSIKLYVKLNNDCIKELKYKVFGCSTTIALSSIISEFLKGKDIMYLMNLKEENLPIQKNDLEETRRHSFDLIFEGIKKVACTIKENKSVRI